MTKPLYVVTVLTGSFLLFLVQPMFARMALPRLGGSPSVWNVAMVFYQAALLCGYLYAHGLQRLRPSAQIVIHVLLLAVALATMPVAVAAWLPEPRGSPALWLIELLAVSIGPAFLLVAAQAPLMQSWFARTAHRDAADPTFLYAASNAGSLGALLCYPLVIEPLSTLHDQGRGWGWGLVLLVVLVVACGSFTAGTGATDKQPLVASTPVTWRERLRWSMLAAIPSGLLLSTTTHLTTDLVAFPLLWVVPLSTYLLSFIVAFGRNGRAWTRGATWASSPLLIVLGASTFLTSEATVIWFAVAGVLLLFVLATALHGALATRRPAAAGLTEFYLYVSLGGVIGGVFCGLVAPAVFNWGYEQPILIVAAALAITGVAPGRMTIALWQGERSGRVMRLLPGLTAVTSLTVAATVGTGVAAATGMVAIPFLIVATTLSIGRRPHFAWHLAMLTMALGGWRQVAGIDGPIERARSFFGIYAVSDNAPYNLRELRHGTTLHGIQSLDPALARRPMSYYAPDSGVGQILAGLGAVDGPHARIAFVGLGAGTLSCYATAGQDWTAYEIDPLIVAIARDPHLFTYLARCRPGMPVIVGDARLKLADAPDGRYDVLVVDAFTSDAVPIHLMTAEAFALYGRVVAPGGVVLIHVSNRYLDLEPVVAAIGRSEGWTVRVRRYVPPPGRTGRIYDSASTWIALTRTPAVMSGLLAATALGPGGWRPARDDGRPPWTDDHASVLTAISRRGSKG